ncbi:MAG: LptF/LptG family permease [bacterium JZ-2024 1]
MRLYHKIILRELIPLFLFGVLAFTTLMVSVLLLRPLLTYLVEYGAPVRLLALIFVLGLPQAMTYSLPMGMLLGGIMAINRLSSRGEMQAMFSSGLSFVQVLIPIALFGLIFSGVGLAVEEFVNPVLRKESRDLEQSIREEPNYEMQNVVVPEFSEEGGSISRLIVASRYTNGRFEEVTWSEFVNQRIRRIAEASIAVPTGKDTWTFYRGRLTELREGGGSVVNDFESMEVRFPTEGIELKVKANKPEEMSLRDLYAFIRELRQWQVEKKVILKWETQLYLKWAVPFAALILGIFGSAFGLTRERSPSSVGLGLSVVFSLLYYILMVVAVRVGQSGILSPMSAGWAPNASFALISVIIVGYHTNPFLFHPRIPAD